MENLSNFLSPLSKSDARSTLYYLSRYLKQAAFFKQYRKYIFEDDALSAPSVKIRYITLAMLRMIESVEGTEAKDFDEQTYFRWAERIKGIERQLDPEPTEEDLVRVREFSRNFDLPNSDV